MMNGPMTRTEVRHCIKCGSEIGPEESICASCNRAGMETPSPTQYHGTIVVGVVAAVAALAVAASLSLQGVGPYAAEVRGVAPADPVGFAISYAVTNEGTKPGRAKCQLVALGDLGEQLRVLNTLTTQIPGGGTTEESGSIPGLETEPAQVTISCS
jgi:predicted nucleic acid-binding Zn ribbon protein